MVRTPAAGRHRAGAAIAGSMILAGSLAERAAVLAGLPSACATAGGEKVRATAAELGRPPRPAWQR